MECTERSNICNKYDGMNQERENEGIESGNNIIMNGMDTQREGV